jgi:SpoIID/LytB domain protein
MEWYLYGVVPRESPSGWRPEALKAQAVAARSYAYTDTKSELYCTTWDQAYQGYGGYNSYGVWVGEVSSTSQAVDATKDEVVKYGTTIIRTFFFSQSGGHTANNDDVWVSGAAQPYLRGVPDVYEHLAGPTLSPWPATREKTLTGLQLRDALGSVAGVPPSPAEVERITPEFADSGHMRYMTFHFSTGVSVRVSGDTVRSRLGLLSTAFYVAGFPVDRIAGANRYETSAAVSRAAFPETAPAVVVASGEDYPDALTGSAVAGAVGGPLLLSANASLSAATEIELRRLKPAAVYIMGSDVSISAAAEQRIRAVLPGAEVTRFAGRNRYETAWLAARFVRSMTGSTGAILVSGTGWPDAASASALAYAEKYPILLTRAASLSGEAAAYLKANTPATVLIVGGTPTVALNVETDAAAAAGVTPVRLAGSDRYATSAAVARYCVSTAGFTVDRAYLATGLLYPDALTGGTLAGVGKRPLLLMRPDSVPGGTASFLREHRATIAVIGIFGGLPTISQAGVDSISTVMMQ